LGDGDLESEEVYSEENNILYWADQSGLGTKIYFKVTTSPTNQPRKNTLIYVIQESSFASVTTVSCGHPSLVSLG
jgi:hypothetical protein